MAQGPQGRLKMMILAVHKTDEASARSILENGFDLRHFGSATKKTGQTRFKIHPKGIYLTVDDGFDPESPASHPWDHRDRGVLVFCTAHLANPLTLRVYIDGKFYLDWLSERHAGASTAKLTAAIQKDGHDGIVCEETGEVIVFDPKQIQIDGHKTERSLGAYERWRQDRTGFREWLCRVKG